MNGHERTEALGFYISQFLPFSEFIELCIMDFENVEKGVFAAVSDVEGITPEMKRAGLEIYLRIFDDLQSFGFWITNFPQMKTDESRVVAF